MDVPSLLRLEEHKALSNIELSGHILDLGGERRSDYLRLFKGQFETTVLNMDEKTGPDITHDLEMPLPIPDASYDHVLLINVLEHVFAYERLLREAARILRPGGSAIVVVPFLFPNHPSPEDYRRFTASALRKELQTAGLKDVTVQALGGGVWAACYVMVDRLLPRILRLLNFYTFRYLTVLLDGGLAVLARAVGKKYRAEDYALGFCAVARKS